MKKVITYGTFDLFHEGHYKLLQRAKELGDYLIVGVTSDNYDKERGKLGVVDSLLTRVENVKKTGFADEVIVEETTGQKIEDIQKYGIDIFTVGSDWVGKFDSIKKYCEVVYLERTKNISSTMIRESSRVIQRIGIIGTGRIANRFVLEAKSVSGVNVQAVYNPHMDSANRFAKEWELNPYSDIERFYEDIDIVYIASPHETHYDYARAALLRCKHVICEKPMTLLGYQISELYEMAQKNSCVLMEGIKTAHCPGFIKLLKIVDSGIIGTISNIEACFTKLESPNKRELIDIEYGGSITELGSYILLPVVKLLGTQYDDVTFECLKADNGVDIFSKINFKYQRALATLTCGLGVKSDGRLLISGTKGYILCKAPWWKTTEFEVHFEDESKTEKYQTTFIGDGLRYEISDFLSLINRKDEIDYGKMEAESLFMANVIEMFLKYRKEI